MTMRSMRRAAIGVLVIAAGGATAQEKAASFTKGTVLVVDYAAPGKMMPDAKDQALAKALEMIPSRVRELPREIHQLPPQAASAINTVMSCIGKPGRLTVAYDGELPSGGLFGYGVAFSFLIGDQKVSEEIHGTVSSLMAESGQRIKTTNTRWKGMSDIQMGPALLSYGPRQAKDGWRYEVVVGTMNDADGAAGALPTTTEFEPVIRARMDFAGLTPLKEMAAQFGGPAAMAGPAFEQLEGMGLMGSNALKISYLAGHSKDDSVSHSIWEGAKKYADKLHMSQKPLTAAELGAVPADATEVYIARMGDEGFGYLLDMVGENPMIEAGLEDFATHTGVNLREDLLDALGGAGVFYMSDTTGGGGVVSAVAMMSFRDRAKAVSAINKLAGFANTHADENPMGVGYIRLASWKDGDTDLLTLRFPGVPVPMELTFAMTKNWLVFSPTVQGTIAAARQASGKGDGGLMANASFKARFPQGKELLSVGFSDTPRTMGDGYWLLSFLGSAVANGVRSPSDPSREPGLVVPLLNDLKKGAKARISYSYWKGEDLVTETRADRSGLVVAAGTISMVQKVLPFVALPAIGAAQERGMVQGPLGAGREFVRLGIKAMPVWMFGPVELAAAAMPESATDRLPEALRELQRIK